MTRHILRLIWNKKRSNALLFLEIFFAFLILFAVFTIVTRYMRMYQSPLGYQTENIWIVHMNLDPVTDTVATQDMKVRLKQELKALPEVQSASYSGFVTPISNSSWSTSSDDNGFEISTHMMYGDPDYMETMGINLVQGRWFNESDRDARYEPLIISKKLFDESFEGRNITDSIYNINGEKRIIGVIDHFKYKGDFAEEVNLSFFYGEDKTLDLPNLHLRVAPGTPAAFEEEVNNLVADITKRNDFRIEHLQTTRESRARQVWIPIVALLSICGFLVINVSMGLFGILWYTISKRRSEIGLRRTLGASRSEITLQFVGEILAVCLSGILLGIVFAVQLPLLNVFPIEALNYYIAMGLSATLILILVVACSFYPSQQAARIHPALALHEE